MRSKIMVSTVLSLALAGTAFAVERSAAVSVEAAAQAAAARTLKELVGKPGPRPVGVPEAENVTRADLGDPYVVSMVRLDQLKEYQPGSDPNALLRDTMMAVYPIRVAGQVQGEMVMSKIGGTWSARSFAGPGHIQAMEKARGALTSATRLAAGPTLLVRVPALRVEFIAHRDASGTQLTPVADLAAAGLKAGQSLPAARVFELLLPLANRHNGQLS